MGVENLSNTCVDHYTLLLKYLSNHMHFITNGYKYFLKTNSTDPRQRVPLTIYHTSNYCKSSTSSRHSLLS